MRRIKKKNGCARIDATALVFPAALLCIMAICGCGKQEAEEEAFTEIAPEEIVEDTESAEDTAGGDAGAGEAVPEEEWIFVHVCGQVKNPGVYELAADSRLYQALEAAGGLKGDAATEYLNQAQILEDGQQVYVPAKAEVEAGIVPGPESAAGAGTGGASGDASGGKVNLNQASKEELMTLTGIGEVKAAAIVQYREEHGNFQSIEAIKEVDGIKDGTYQKIKDDITV